MATDYYETLGQEDVDFGVEIVAKRNPGGGSMSTTQVNIASLARNQSATTATWAPTIDSGSYAYTTVTVEGAETSDIVQVSLDTIGSNKVQMTGHVSAANEVTVVITNFTGVQVAIASGTLKVLCFASR